MIEWKKIDPNNPPEGPKLFIYNGAVYDGWILDEEDDDGYPLWETSANLLGKLHYVRWYADLHIPAKCYRH